MGGDVTQILDALARGDGRAAAQFWPLVYDDLRRLAARQLAGEAAGQTLQPTALVHEAYLRLAAAPPGRSAHPPPAGTATPRILIDRARGRKSAKRGGGRDRAAVDPDQLAAPERSDDLLA